MAAFAESFPAIQRVLAEQYGRPESVFEGLSEFERVIAAGVLGSNPADRRRSSAVARALDRAGLSRPEVLAEAELIEIADALQEEGVQLSLKAIAVLRQLARWYADEFPDRAELEGKNDKSGGDAEAARLREGLVRRNGIGPARADAILLALGFAVYPVDRGTFRVLVRHGWIDASASYGEASELLSQQLKHDPKEIAALAQGMAQVGRRFCKIKVPQCQACPLAPFLPERGPLEPNF